MTKIMNFVTWVVFGLFWVSMATIDCESWTPFIVCIACWIWLAVAAIKNGLFYDPDLERVEDDDE